MTRSKKKPRNAKHHAAKHAMNVRAREMKSTEHNFLASVPQISEDDLLSFQISHFGDDSKPVNWFIDAETALHFQSQNEEDDGLGYYPDGVKRTLTDEQIEIFRKSELWRLEREKVNRQAEEQESLARKPSLKVTQVQEALGSALATAAQETNSVLQGAEGEDSGMALSPRSTSPVEGLRSRQTSHDNLQRHGQREDHRSLAGHSRAKRQKRPWDKYVEAVDETHGAMTHRRIARELDEQVSKDVELDY